MDEEPKRPSREAGQVRSFDISHGFRSPDRGHVALVAVAERPMFAVAKLRAHGTCGVSALLHRDGGEAGEWRDGRVGGLHADHVAKREYLRVPGEREVG